MSTSSYSLIEKLVDFQNSFINLVHSQILSFSQAEQVKEALLKFQILRMGDKNQVFNDMVSTLKKQLIEEKQESDTVLKNYFTKILDLDFLPLLHINRYELTKLAIFGFDIYIDPLEAILQILNRLERTFYILEESLKHNSEEYFSIRQRGPWQILLSGWSNYYVYLNFYKLSLNIYMLKEYIQTAETSLFKKDKEIIFTGVYNFYKKLIPKLTSMQQIQFLEELADLNNTMYSFHASFDYFLFYTCLKPEKKFIKIYDRINDLERKCKTTNILTPLLFGILNNSKAFANFINQVQSPEYIHLLRVLLSGLVINFKLRILEYDQVLELIGATITKLNLLKGMKFEIITGDLGKEWRQAKDFFISAFKSGYSVGEIQTWNLCEVDNIQPKIRNFLILGTLLLESSKYDDFIKCLQKTELEEILSSQISELTSASQTLSSLANNWKKNPMGEGLSNQAKCLNIVRIVNLLNILENFSEKLLYVICSAMIDVKGQTSLFKQILADTSETINSMVTVVNRKESISNLKYMLPEFHKKFTPKGTFEDIVPVYLHCFIVKEALDSLLEVIETIQKQKVLPYVKQILTSVIQKCCLKPQNTFQTLKNFQNAYKVPFDVVYMDSEITSVFTSLTKIIDGSQGSKLQIAFDMLVNLLRYCPWNVISVMNLPALIDQKIESFLSWLVKNKNPKSGVILTEMLRLIRQFAQKKEAGNLKEYLQQYFYFTVLDTILNQLTALTNEEKWHEETSNNDTIINLIQLFVEIQRKFLKVQRKQSDEQNQEDTFKKIWYSLLELLSYILKNNFFCLSRIKKCCNLYWAIIKRLKGQSIGEWYTKNLFNIIFQQMISESRSSYDIFRGISLISSSKNYMISRERQGQNYENTKSSVSERNSFSEIKYFLQDNFKPISNRNIESQQSLSELNNFNEYVLKFIENQAPIKISSISLLNDKEILPTMSSETLSQLYQAYCESDDKSKPSIEFCLNLIKLDCLNHRTLWKLAKNNEKAQFLDKLSFTKETIGQIFEIIPKIEKETSKTNNQVNSLFRMLNLQFLTKYVNELELLASSFYFDSSKIEFFLNKKKLLWFMIVCNNSNWREFNETFSNYLKHQNFMSTLLQYKEFLLITKKSSKDYEDKISQFTSILQNYVFYIEKKIFFIKLLKNTDSNKQNEIRKTTLLLNVKLTLLKCEFEKILQRMIIVAKLLDQNLLESCQFINFISTLHRLNSFCNFLVEGNIALPNFSNHNRYMTQNSEKSQFLLGKWLENFQNVVVCEKAQNYSCQKESYLVKTNLKDFMSNKFQESENDMLKVLAKDINSEDLHQSFIQLREKLKNLLKDQSETLEVNWPLQIKIKSQILAKFYQMGYLLYFEHKKSGKSFEENLQKVSLVLKHMIKRQSLPVELLKQADPSSYHHLKLIIMNENRPELNKNSDEPEEQEKAENVEENLMSEKQRGQKNYFVWREKQLIEGGKNIKVTSSNKSLYVELLAEQILGKQYLILNNALALGYFNAICFNQN